MTNTADSTANGDTNIGDTAAEAKSKQAGSNGQKTTDNSADALGQTGSEAQSSEPYVPVPITIKSLMAAGAHFGHQTPRWNPKMTKYIFGERNGIHILNLDITLDHWQQASKFIKDVVGRGGEVLIVGTKPQAQRVVREAAQRCGAYYIVSRWLGGTLSNFQTIKNSIARMRKLEELLVKAEDPNSEINLAKKERLKIRKDLVKLEANLGGIKNMKKIPDVIFVVDIIKESIAVSEARKLHVPIVGLVDTNTDPTPIDFPIPSNDDAARTIMLFTNAIADVITEGRREYAAKKSKDARESKAAAKAKSSKTSKKKEVKAEKEGETSAEATSVEAAAS
ncbi:MAG: 30S ribosomal protein S2 [Bdellovibrionota bacterium]